MAFTRRGGRSPERAERVREAPAAQDACPRHLKEVENLLGGASGGMQGGPRRGRSPITGPTLPRAAQASQSPVRRKIPCPKGRKIKVSLPRNAKRARTPRRRPNRLSGEKSHARRAEKLKDRYRTRLKEPRAAQASQSPVRLKIPRPQRRYS